ncbi:MAG: Glycosyl transferase, family 2 [Microgenomates group bacterium GW2011_GWA2_46_7]|nr:MAG: Glycosyl transferase, family 2 [Microgenomates group bacterium GW2011_GWA2_46_7]
MATPKVSVVIPSWNSESQLKQNLPYVFKAAAAVKAEIVVVDDASAFDQSAEYLRSLGSKIRFFENLTNGGFSYTVNRGVSLAQGDIVILLNTDVRPSPDCFVHCLKHFSDPSVFAVTFNSGEAWAGGRWEGGLLQHAKVEPTQGNARLVNPSLWASGGQAAFDRQKWLSLGGMDLLYKPFYWEDVDLGYRAWKRGWRIVWDPKSQCVHDHQKSVIASNFTPEFVRATAQRNQFLFVWKNIHDAHMIISHLRKIPSFIKNYPAPFFRALALLPTALKGRGVERRLSTCTDQEVLSHWS